MMVDAHADGEFPLRVWYSMLREVISLSAAAKSMLPFGAADHLSLLLWSALAKSNVVVEDRNWSES